jgi:Pullulanase X25 domain
MRGVRELVLRVVLLTFVTALISLGTMPIAGASHTPDPTSVTVAGSLQSELGCPGDWQPDCPNSHLSYDANDDVWQGTLTLLAGSYEYKAALNDSWDENYGLHAEQNGANIGLEHATNTAVKFYYDHKSHWIADSDTQVIATVPGNFQSEIGCPGDWDPSCLRSWLEDPDGDGIFTYATSAIPAGDYEAKVAINEGWDENYGAGGILNGQNIPFTVPSSANVLFSYNPVSHILSISMDCTDQTPPTLSVSASPSRLWPPDHKYRTVVASTTFADDTDPSPVLGLVSVTSNEPDSGLNRQDKPNDIVIVDDHTFRLRAERSDTGTGRIYTITYRVTDVCDNATVASAIVIVPHDRPA